MPAANIEINGVAGSDDDLPINVLVQLSNADTGGEVTYLWEILDQPEGTADVLSSAAIENPTFTPKKEGSYLIRLTVNAALSTVVRNLAVAAVRQLKTFERIPAAGETIEVDSAKGWKIAANRMLAVADDTARDANLIVCVNPGASFPTTGDIVRLTQTALIKTGLPGEERLLLCETALATAAANVVGQLGVVIGAPDGGAPVASGIVIVRLLGLVEVTESGAPTIGDPVYVSDTAQPSLTPGTNSRRIGRVVFSTAGVWRWFVDATTEAAWASTSATLGLFLGRQVLAGSGTYTPTAGTRKVRLQLVGGGGGSGGALGGGGSVLSVSAGGGSGAFIEKLINPGAGALITGGAYAVGAAGAGGAAGANPGSAGADTTITVQSVLYTAMAGNGGSSMGSAGTNATSLGGAPQTGSGPSDFEAGSPGTSGTRMDFTTATGGIGGSNPLGQGGNGVATGNTVGAVGRGFGAGGGGSVASNISQTGAAGTAGTIIIDEFS